MHNILARVKGVLPACADLPYQLEKVEHIY